LNWEYKPRNLCSFIATSIQCRHLSDWWHGR